MHARPLVLALLLSLSACGGDRSRAPAPMSRLPPGEVSYTPPGEALRKGYPVTPAPLTARFPNGLAIMTRQVSQAEYAACVRAGGCRTPDPAQRAPRRRTCRPPGSAGATPPPMPPGSRPPPAASCGCRPMRNGSTRPARRSSMMRSPRQPTTAIRRSAGWPNTTSRRGARRRVSPSSCDPSAATAPIRPDCGTWPAACGLDQRLPHAPRAGRGARRGRTGGGQLRHPRGRRPAYRLSAGLHPRPQERSLLVGLPPANLGLRLVLAD